MIQQKYNLNYINVHEIYFKKLVVIYVMLYFLLFIELHYRVGIPRIIWITISSINFIGLYFSFKYSTVELNPFIIKIMKMLIIFIFILSFFYMVKNDEFKFRNINFIIETKAAWKSSLVFNSILISLIFNATNLNRDNKEQEEDWKKYIAVKYIIIFVAIIIICNLDNSNEINKVLSYRLLYMISIYILTSTLITCRQNLFSKDKNLNITKLVVVLLILVDLVSFIFIQKDIFYYMSIIRFTLSNLFLSIFIVKLINLDSDTHYKNLKKINENLDSINYMINERNIQLEETRKILIRQNYIYKKFLKIVTIPIAIISEENNRILYINKKFLELCDKKQIREVINRKLDSFIVINKKILNKSAERKEFFIGSLVGKDSTTILEICFIESGNNKIIIINDITEKENIDRIKKELERKKIDEKMKSNFLSHISHDLKTPIGVIYSSIQLQDVYLNKNNREDFKKYNLTCKENCLYLARLTNNLMDISRITEKSLKPILEQDNIVYFIEDKIKYLSEYAKLKEVSIIFDTNQEEIFIYFDKNFTERVILNLLSNALKYSNNRGVIMINIVDKIDEVDIEISDNGKGMSKEFGNRAFNIYAMENNENEKNYQSNGLGLFVVYNLLKLQKANISLDSQLGKGSKFTLTYRKGNII